MSNKNFPPFDLSEFPEASLKHLFTEDFEVAEDIAHLVSRLEDSIEFIDEYITQINDYITHLEQTGLYTTSDIFTGDPRET